MSANLGALRWASPAVASACHEVKDLAPALGSLLYDPAMPEPSLQVLLDWADIAADPASMRAFELSRLGRVLPAMVRAYIASHHYRLERAAGQDQEFDRLDPARHGQRRSRRPRHDAAHRGHRPGPRRRGPGTRAEHRGATSRDTSSG